MKRLHGNRLRGRILTVCLLILTILLVSCRGRESRDRSIRIAVEETVLQDGSTVQIPSFVTDDEQIQKNLRDLDRQTKILQRTVEREQRKNNRLEMKCHLLKIKGYPQVTVVWSVEENNILTYNIMTLAADEKEGLPITCKEALERTGMSGVDLSLKVGRLVKEERIRGKIRGELSSTEMQGFIIGEDGEVSEIYMKVTMEVEEGEEKREDEHFFSYIPKEEKLEKLSEKGFEVP